MSQPSHVTGLRVALQLVLHCHAQLQNDVQQMYCDG